MVALSRLIREYTGTKNSSRHRITNNIEKVNNITYISENVKQKI